MTVFASLYAGQYDQLYADKDYGAECSLIEAAFERFGSARPESVLDVGCGTGGHAIELAHRGYAMTGVDLSEHMLEHARARAAALPAPQRPHWLCGNAIDFSTGRVFDAATMMFAVIGYLTTNDAVLAGLRNIRSQLKPGALFVCDFWYGPSVLSVRPADRVRVLHSARGQVIRKASTTLDVVRHTADVNFRLWTLEQDRLVGEAEETHRLRYFFPQEFALFLQQAGFSQCNLTAFPSLDEPLTDQSWNALVVARAT
jgi:SAM-dependent methyltransferase